MMGGIVWACLLSFVAAQWNKKSFCCLFARKNIESDVKETNVKKTTKQFYELVLVLHQFLFLFFLVLIISFFGTNSTQAETNRRIV